MSPEIAVAAKQIRYEATVWLEGKTFVAHAWPIDVNSCGGSEEHALQMLEEAVALFVETARDMGTIEEILEDAGYRLEGDVLLPPNMKHFVASARVSP